VLKSLAHIRVLYVDYKESDSLEAFCVSPNEALEALGCGI
jgi:hypothetical protein